MSAVVAPSGECLRGNGRIISNFSAVVFGSLFARAKPCRWLCLDCVPWCIALSRVSAGVLRSVLSSNNKVDDDLNDTPSYLELRQSLGVESCTRLTPERR